LDGEGSKGEAKRPIFAIAPSGGEGSGNARGRSKYGIEEFFPAVFRPFESLPPPDGRLAGRSDFRSRGEPLDPGDECVKSRRALDADNAQGWEDPAGKPAAYRIEPPPGVPRWNGIDDPHEVTIEDARGREAEFTLDCNGFALIKAPTAVADFYDAEEIKRVYYPERNPS
jgi:hypothetical protein